MSYNGHLRVHSKPVDVNCLCFIRGRWNNSVSRRVIYVLSAWPELVKLTFR